LSDRFVTTLQSARGRHSAFGVFIGEAELYCRNPECSARGVRVEIKEHDGPTAPPRPACPFCRRPLSLHHVLTREERLDADETAARGSVNAQLYRQRHGDEAAVPIEVLLDDSLPGGSTST
jgi:hypothetical protein